VLTKKIIATAVTAVVACSITLAPMSARADQYPYPRKPCNVIYQGQCVQWYTSEASCHDIFNTGASATKKQACAIWRATGQVHVIY